jgi:Tfp pilus assembly protein FimV
MKILTALLLTFLLAPAFAAPCPKNSDACSGGAKSSSPFLAASLAAAVNTEAKAAAVKTAPAAPAKAPAQAAVVQVSSSPAAIPPASPAKSSSPAWLFVVGGGLAGLYFYLAGGSKKGKRK